FLLRAAEDGENGVDARWIVLKPPQGEFLPHELASGVSNAGINIGQRRENRGLDGRVGAPVGLLEEAGQEQRQLTNLRPLLLGEDRNERSIEQVGRWVREETELAVVAYIDHRLGAAGIESPLEERAVERPEDRLAL